MPHLGVNKIPLNYGLFDNLFRGSCFLEIKIIFSFLLIEDSITIQQSLAHVIRCSTSVLL